MSEKQKPETKQNPTELNTSQLKTKTEYTKKKSSNKIPELKQNWTKTQNRD